MGKKHKKRAKNTENLNGNNALPNLQNSTETQKPTIDREKIKSEALIPLFEAEIPKEIRTTNILPTLQKDPNNPVCDTVQVKNLSENEGFTWSHSIHARETVVKEIISGRVNEEIVFPIGDNTSFSMRKIIEKNYMSYEKLDEHLNNPKIINNLIISNTDEENMGKVLILAPDAEPIPSGTIIGICPGIIEDSIDYKKELSENEKINFQKRLGDSLIPEMAPYFKQLNFAYPQLSTLKVSNHTQYIVDAPPHPFLMENITPSEEIFLRKLEEEKINDPEFYNEIVRANTAIIPIFRRGISIPIIYSIKPILPGDLICMYHNYPQWGNERYGAFHRYLFDRKGRTIGYYDTKQQKFFKEENFKPNFSSLNLPYTREEFENTCFQILKEAAAPSENYYLQFFKDILFEIKQANQMKEFQEKKTENENISKFIYFIERCKESLDKTEKESKKEKSENSIKLLLPSIDALPELIKNIFDFHFMIYQYSKHYFDTRAIMIELQDFFVDIENFFRPLITTLEQWKSSHPHDAKEADDLLNEYSLLKKYILFSKEKTIEKINKLILLAPFFISRCKQPELKNLLFQTLKEESTVFFKQKNPKILEGVIHQIPTIPFQNSGTVETTLDQKATMFGNSKHSLSVKNKTNSNLTLKKSEEKEQNKELMEEKNIQNAKTV